MKIIISLKPFNNKIFYRNAVFNENSEVGSEYLIAAKNFLEEKNIILRTIDIDSSNSTIRDVYMDIPYPWELKLWMRIIKNVRKNILFIVEPPIVNPFNFMKIFHLFFSKIYTWNDLDIDNISYFKYYLPVTTKGLKTNKTSFNKKKLLVLMNANWLPFLPFKILSFPYRELYTTRIKAIEFFDSNYPAEFSLYGRGWNKPQKFSIKQRLLGYKKYKTYKGEFLSKNKYKILSNFKFCLCFENCQIEGNISEKIIDCFKAGCVPIYFGAPNITDYISSNCFIDYRKFNSFNDLAVFISGMDEKTYDSYLREINKFLSSKEFLDNWTSEAFAKVFWKSVN